MASFHPEAELDEARYFDKIRMLKDADHNVILRFVGQPQRLPRMAELADRCRELDVSFAPTAMFSNRYPGAYSKQERELLQSHFSSIAQHIQLDGGLDTTGLSCYAGSRMIAMNLQTGNITPCITVSGPSLGNIFEDRLELNRDPIRCPEPGISCICDVHYQQNIVIGVHDRENFADQMRGFTPPRDLRSEVANLQGRDMHLHRPSGKGIGDVADDTRSFFAISEIKENYRQIRGLPRMSVGNRDLHEMPGIAGAIGPAGSGSTVDLGSPVRIVSPQGRWSYAALVPIATLPAGIAEIWVRVRARVSAGAAGFGLLNRAGDAFHERAFVDAGTERITFYLRSSAPSDVAAVIIQNSSPDGEPAEVELFDVSVLADVDSRG